MVLFVRGIGIEWRFAHLLNLVLQFFLGGIFSALVIFYFLSSSNLPAFVVVLLLVSLLVANEFLERKYEALTLSWTMFAVCGVMLFNFAFPHLTRSVSRWWFYVSTTIAVVCVLLLRRLVRQERVTIIPAMIAVIVLVALRLLDLVPPVPLVQKKMLIAHNVKHGAGGFAVTVERQGMRRLNPFAEQLYHAAPGDRVYCFTSVFIPRGIESTLRHRWMYRQNGEWKTSDVISFKIRGGRNEGYRAYTFKRSLHPGLWRVVTETEYGARLGITDFHIVQVERRVNVKTVRL